MKLFKLFQRKKGYKKSSLYLNEYLNAISKWDVDEIEKRQDFLFDNYAKKIWKIDGLKNYTQKPKKAKK